MKRILLIAILLFPLISIAEPDRFTTERAAVNDNNNVLVGKWFNHSIIREIEFKVTNTLYPDGTFDSLTTFKDGRVWTCSGNWQVSGNRLVWRYLESTIPGSPPGTIDRNIIVEVSDTMLRIREQSGMITQWARVDESSNEDSINFTTKNKSSHIDIYDSFIIEDNLPSQDSLPVEVEYRSYDYLIRKNMSADSVPPGGKLMVIINRPSVHMAKAKNFSIVIFEYGKRKLQINSSDGEDNLFRNPDGTWKNSMEIDILDKLEGEFKVYIMDMLLRKSYEFAITRKR
jgi:hypothetical protein